MALVQGTMLYAAELTWSGQRGIEGEYQRAINQMARATLGAFRSTLQGILAEESGLTPARALLDHQQARFAYRLHVRPQARDGGGPEEIQGREGTALARRLRAAAALRLGTAVEAQEWGNHRLFPGQVIVENREGALQTASSWSGRDTIWTNRSRLDSGKVGAACVWRTRVPADGPSKWTGHRYYLGNNKEVFDAELYAIFRALSIIDQRQKCGHRYTIFGDSTAAIDRIRSDSIGPGQHLAVASIEVCTRILARDNEVSIHWNPAHHGVLGNEKADEYTKVAVRGESQRGAAHMVPDQYRWETSLSHMSRVATKAWSRAATRWMADRFGDLRRRYQPPSGRGLRRRLLRGVPKSIASRYYQLLSGHAAIGPYLKDRIHKATDDRCWWCGGGKQQTCHHLFTQCRAWLPQIRTL